jgi:cyclic-di-GMP phosphodiesterase, flagellum assembly factor TipF
VIDVAVDWILIGGAIALSLFALLRAWWVERRVRALSDELNGLARAVDSLARGSSRRDDMDFVSHEELTRALAREVEILNEKFSNLGTAAPDKREDPSPEPAFTNVLDHPTRESVQARLATPESEDRNRAIEERLRDVAATGHTEISLQPIVSMALGEAVAFDVFACLDLGGNDHASIRRPNVDMSFDLARFERALVLATIDTARRRLGSMSERMMLHVPVSAALMANEAMVAEIGEMLRVHPAIAHSIVITLPARALLQQECCHAARALSDAGLTIAIDNWDDELAGSSGLPPIAFIKLGARQLLDPSSRDKGNGLREAADRLDARIVANDVVSDEEAMSLIDGGVDLMSGERFSDPRRLKPEREPVGPDCAATEDYEASKVPPF